MGEGQFELADDESKEFDRLDNALVGHVEKGDEAALRADLEMLTAWVRKNGKRLPDDYLGTSDLVLPTSDSSLQEVKALLDQEGLISG